MTKKDWLLAAIANAGDQGLSPIQIQKTMFLMRMEASEFVGQNFYTFEPYNYGPFSSPIYQDVDYLVLSGFVRELPNGRHSLYVITDAGRARAAELAAGANAKAVSYLVSLVNWVKSVSFSQLLRSVYAKYPKYAEKSLFKN